MKFYLIGLNHNNGFSGIVNDWFSSYSSCYMSTISTNVQINLGFTFLLMTLISSRSLYADKNVKIAEASNILLQRLYVWLTGDKLKLNT